MSTRNRIPPAIGPYIRNPPEASLILLTGTLGCSPNWLTALFVEALLGPTTGIDRSAGDGRRCGVILASWLRNEDFWRDQVKRITGLDISKLSQQGSFAFLDFLNSHSDSGTTLSQEDARIRESISKLSGNDNSRLLLIFDSPDVLLATQSTSTYRLNHFLINLRSLVHSTVVACSADSILISAAVPSTVKAPAPMDVETAAFITQQGHNSRFVMAVRELPSGAAKDVSGILRISRGSGYGVEDSLHAEGTESELLYLVQKDGNVKAFGRGEGT